MYTGGIVSFKSKLFGYDKNEVNSYINRIKLENEQALEEKEKDLANIREKARLAQLKVDELQNKIDSIYEKKGKIADILLKVQEKAELMEQETVKKCEDKKLELDNEIANKAEELSGIKKDINTLKEDVITVLDKYRTQLDAMSTLYSDENKDLNLDLDNNPEL